MSWRASILLIPVLSVLILPQPTYAQDIDTLKKGVVRVKNTRFGDIGTGFIVKRDGDLVYIVTAAHVVRGNEHPDVFLINLQNEPSQGTLINREDDDIRGLALLSVKVKKDALAGLMALSIGSSSGLSGGEGVQIIGFPGGTNFWSVTPSHITRMEGRNLIVRGAVEEGYSGGPVLLKEQVVGLITDIDQEATYAVQAESIELYLRGINSKLFQNVKPQSATSQPVNAQVPVDEFCQSLSQIISASRDSFYSIVKESASRDSRLEPSVVLPGTSSSYLSTEFKYVKYSTDSKTNPSTYYALISRIKSCLVDWKQSDSSEDAPIWNVGPKYHQFMEGEKGVVIDVTQGKSGRDELYFTEVSIYAPDSSLNPRRRSRIGHSAQSALSFLNSGDTSEEVCQAVQKIVSASHDDFFSIVKPWKKGGVNIIGMFMSTIEMPGFPSGSVTPRDRVRFTADSDNSNEVESLYYKLAAITKSCLSSWKQKESPGESSILNKNIRSYSYRFFEPGNGSVVEISYTIYSNTTYHSLVFSIYAPKSPWLPK